MEIHGKRILVIDNCKSWALRIVETLQSAGCEVLLQEACNLEQAKSAGPFDLVFVVMHHAGDEKTVDGVLTLGSPVFVCDAGSMRLSMARTLFLKGVRDIVRRHYQLDLILEVFHKCFALLAANPRDNYEGFRS